MKQRLLVAWLVALSVAATLLALRGRPTTMAPSYDKPDATHYGTGRVPPPITINAIDFGAVHNGVTDDSLAILAAAQVAADGGAQSQTERFHPGVYLIGQTTVMPASVKMSFDYGAILKPALGVTLTVPAQVDAVDTQQIFDITAGGTVVWQTQSPSLNYAGISRVSAIWWGADPTGVVDSAPAINAAILAASNLPFNTVTLGSADPRIGYEVDIPAGTYRQNEPILIPRRTILRGAGGSNEATTILKRPPGVQGIVVTFEDYGLHIGGDAGSTPYANAGGTVVEGLQLQQTAYGTYPNWQPSTVYDAGAVVQANIGNLWLPSHTYAAGELVSPVAYQGYYFIQTSGTGGDAGAGSGVSGATEPQWTQPASADPGVSTVADDTIVWTMVGAIPETMFYVAQSSGTSGTGQPQWPSGPTDSLNQVVTLDNTVPWVAHEKGVAIRMYAKAHIDNVGIQYCEDTGIDINSCAGSHPLTVADDWHVSRTIVQNCQRHGIIARNCDDSAGTCINSHFSSNGGWGVVDRGFLGNTWIGLDAESNLGGPYALISQNAQSVLLGCYSEADQHPSNILYPNLAIGGDHAAGFTTYSVGIIGGNGQGLTLSPSQILTDSIASGHPYNFTVGEQGQPSLLMFQSFVDNDPSFLRQIYDPTTKRIVWDVFNATTYEGMAISDTAYREGAPNLEFPRGISVGPYGQAGFSGALSDSGPRISSGTAPPSSYVAASNINFARVGDILVNTNPLANGIDHWVATSRGAWVSGPWASATTYHGGALVTTSTNTDGGTGSNGFAYRAVGNGTSGGAQPSALASTTTIGATVADGSGAGAFSWECFGATSETWMPVMASGGLLVHNMTSDANYALATTETLYGTVDITDTTPVLSTQRNIVLPLFAGQQKSFHNATLQTLQFIGASGTGFTLASGKNCGGWTDGTNWYQTTAPN